MSIRTILSASRPFRVAVLGAAGTLAVLAAACGSDTPPATATTAPSLEATATPPAASVIETPTLILPGGTSAAEQPTPTPETVLVAPEAYDPDEMMFRLFDELLANPVTFSQGLELVRLSGDVSQVPVLVEILDFMGASAMRQRVAEVLGELTGHDFGAGDRKAAREWLGANAAELRPPEAYPEWKTFLLSRIHPRFAIFLLRAGETSRIDLTEVVWGGVPPDGIPDLRGPLILPAAAGAGFLEADDRVFGVSINGASRAYPLRIMNAHEIVNDVLGGEPISLAW